MSKLFSEAVRIDEDRSVSVVELPNSGVSIEGITIDEFDGDVSRGTILFRHDAAETLRGIINRWHEAKEEEKNG